jgi:diaminohydroxyphosphoribosylaminopyrimidine deaminase/5-amino-6-(5-phosphoribosylamino)uracil reductase
MPQSVDLIADSRYKVPMREENNFYMSNAVKLALQARGCTSPNPMVGALVVSFDGEILGRGFHKAAGESHAEVIAINDALKTLKDLSTASLFVTLEPCNHVGRTPPCTDYIKKSGIRNLVIGTLDPNPLMSGKSIELLRADGFNVVVNVVDDVSKDETKKLIRGFYAVTKLKRPFVTVKAATSLDGKIATSSGESKWITDEESRAFAHAERAAHDAILVGVGTVLADDPQLTVRHEFKNDNLKKVVLDSRLLTPPTANLFMSKHKVFIYCDATYSGERRKNLECAGATIIPMTENVDGAIPGFLNLKEVLSDLASRGVQELLVEGGARVLGAFVREQLFDRIVYFLAPKILGSTSKDVFEGLDIAELSKSVMLENVSTKLLGRDIVIEGSRVHRPH